MFVTISTQKLMTISINWMNNVATFMSAQIDIFNFWLLKKKSYRIGVATYCPDTSVDSVLFKRAPVDCRRPILRAYSLGFIVG